MFGSKSINSFVSAINSLPANLNEDELMQRMVESIYAVSDFYFVSLYLIDTAREWVVFRAGTGEHGKTFLSRGHRLQIGTTSLVGRAIRFGELQLLDYYDVQLLRISSPLLPDTLWEIALPLRAHDQIIGVLEVEGSERANFKLEDIKPLQQVADEVARKLTLNAAIH
jgi:putative methionine-R-sulfoxide reductase with GAF domain